METSSHRPGILGAVTRFDGAAVRLSHRVRHPALTAVMAVLTYSGSGYVWFSSAGILTALVILGIDAIPAERSFLAAMAGAFLSLVVGQVLKRVVKRPRPHQALPDHESLVTRPGDYSMPSTHSSTAVALMVGLWTMGHPWAPAVTIWAPLVVSTRWYLGVHWVSDVVLGSLLGAAFGLVDWTWMVDLLPSL